MVKVTIQYEDEKIKVLTGDYTWGAVVKEKGTHVRSGIFLTGITSPMDLEQNMESVVEDLAKMAVCEKPEEAAKLLLILSDGLEEKAVELLR